MRKINTQDFHVATRSTSRDINRRIALSLIREHQPISRADLARRMNVTRGAVSVLVQELIDQKVIYEGATGEAMGGLTISNSSLDVTDMGIRKPNSKEFHLTRNLVARLAGMLAIMLCMAAQTFVMAQTPVGQIFGTVKDPNGLPVPGASVVVTDLATGKTFNVKSDETGDYLVRELPPGRYSVAGSFAGFTQLGGT